MRLNFKLEKYVWWQAPLVAAALMLGAKLKLEVDIIPFTLQTFFLCLGCLFLSMQANLLGVFIYLILGIWLPVFSGDTYGEQFYYSPSAGFVYGFIFAAIFITTTKHTYKGWFGIFCWLLLAHAVILTFGTAWAIFYSKWDMTIAIDKAFYGMLPGAIIKSLFASFIYYMVDRYYLPKPKEE